jgi:hypothetical protein
LIKTIAKTDQNVEKACTNQGMHIRMIAELRMDKKNSLCLITISLKMKKVFAMMVLNCSLHCNISEAISGAKMDPSVQSNSWNFLAIPHA